MRSSVTFGLSLSLALASACAGNEPQPEGDELAGESALDGEADDLGKADALGSTFTYFSLRQDMRKCMWPLCGGYFVSRINRAKTRCADGKWAPSCYVAEVDLFGTGLTEAQIGELSPKLGGGSVLLRGKVESRPHEVFTSIPQLVASEAWQAYSVDEPEGTFVRVTSSGIVCITYPCYNTLHEAKINSTLHGNFSELDFDATGADDATLGKAYEQINTDDGLLVAGYRYWFYDGSWQKGRWVAQFYQRIQPAKPGDGCLVSGCSSQICGEASAGPVITTCEWQPIYACYQTATCARQPSGECAWTPTPELEACLAAPPSI
jgi:hypothetical protein